jgi:hypothetical protein
MQKKTTITSFVSLPENILCFIRNAASQLHFSTFSRKLRVMKANIVVHRKIERVFKGGACSISYFNVTIQELTADICFPESQMMSERVIEVSMM